MPSGLFSFFFSISKATDSPTPQIDDANNGTVFFKSLNAFTQMFDTVGNTDEATLAARAAAAAAAEQAQAENKQETETTENTGGGDGDGEAAEAPTTSNEENGDGDGGVVDDETRNENGGEAVEKNGDENENETESEGDVVLSVKNGDTPEMPAMTGNEEDEEISGGLGYDNQAPESRAHSRNSASSRKSNSNSNPKPNGRLSHDDNEDVVIDSTANHQPEAIKSRRNSSRPASSQSAKKIEDE